VASKHFFDADTEPMLVISVDTKYPMPVSVSAYYRLILKTSNKVWQRWDKMWPVCYML